MFKLIKLHSGAQLILQGNKNRIAFFSKLKLRFVSINIMQDVYTDSKYISVKKTSNH